MCHPRQLFGTVLMTTSYNGLGRSFHPFHGGVGGRWQERPRFTSYTKLLCETEMRNGRDHP